MSPVIKLNNIVKTYQSGEVLLTALNGIDLTVEKGELTAIMGESGSGKSTMLNIIGLLDRPTSGNYILSGTEVEKMSDDELSTIRNQKIGFVFQSFFLLPRLTALQNVCMPLRYRGTSNSEAMERGMVMLEKLGVGHLAKHKPNQMSGGQQQRVAMARALVGEPDLILGDEPTGALDSKTSKEVMRLLIEMNEKEGRTIVIVTHDPHVGEQCRRVVRLQDGNIVSDEGKGV